MPVKEVVDPKGNIEVALDECEAEAAVKRLLGEGVEAIAVCLKNSYLNPAHEFAIKKALGAG